MTKQLQIYKCDICGNLVEVLHAGVGELVCCRQPMRLLEEKTEDVGQEKHVPVMEKTDKGILVKIGSVPHPMEENHHIEWIEIVVDGRVQREFLRPGDKPEAEFRFTGEDIKAREYCNLHGLWKS
jgi:superoxide reductase